MIALPDLAKALQVKRYPERWRQVYGHAMSELETRGAFFADESEICRLDSEYALFDEWLGDVLSAAEQLRGNPELLRYLYLLYYAMRDRNAFLQEIGDIDPPLHPCGDASKAFDYALLFAVLPFIPATASELRRRDIPASVYKQTLKMCKSCIIATHEATGKPGLLFMRFLGWMQLLIDARVLSVGRLNFELRIPFDGCIRAFRNSCGTARMLMTGVRLQEGMVLGSAGYTDAAKAVEADFRETDDYFEGYPVDENGFALSGRVRLPKLQWKPALAPGDPVLSVHIPSARRAGGGLEESECEQSYAGIREVMARCYPDYRYKAFSCTSWLMDPQLSALLPPGSGIVQFQRKYMRYPRLSSGRDVFSFVYHNRHFGSYEELPEGNSLLNALKRHFLDGKHIYTSGGIFF